jgi:hypothetical protein
MIRDRTLWSWWPGGLLFFALIFYIPSYSNWFVCDDYQFLGRTTFTNATHYFTKSWGYGNEYRPLLPFSYALDALFSGENPIGYHVTNTALHTANAILVGLLCMRMGLDRKVSALAAVIYAIDPVVHEPVLWISGRPVVLGSFFILSSCYFFVKAADMHGRSGIQYAIAYALFLMALGTYESAVVAPLLAAMLCVASGVAGAKTRHHLLVFAAIAAIYVLAWNVFFDFEITRFPVERSVLGAIGSMMTGIAHAFHGSLTVPAGLVYAVLLIHFFRYAAGRRVTVYALCWFCLAYLPFLIVHGYADRFAYLSSAAVAVVLASAVMDLRRESHYAPVLAAILLSSYLGTGMQNRIKTWKEAGIIARAIPQDIKQAAPVLAADESLVLLNVPTMYKQAYVYLTSLDRALSREYGHDVTFRTDMPAGADNVIVFEYSGGHMLRK